MDINAYKTIEIEQQGTLDILWLNRPEQLNSINTPMVTELRHYFDQLAENENTRVVIMGGRGKAFCAGLDIKSASDPSQARPFGSGMGFSGLPCGCVCEDAPLPTAHYQYDSGRGMWGRVCVRFSFGRTYCSRHSQNECGVY